MCIEGIESIWICSRLPVSHKFKIKIKTLTKQCTGEKKTK